MRLLYSSSPGVCHTIPVAILVHRAASAQNPILSKTQSSPHSRYTGAGLDLARAQNRISVHWCNTSDCYNTDMATYAGIARAFIFLLSASWAGEKLSEEELRQLAATITGFGDDNVNPAGANAPNPGALYLSITRLALHPYGSRDAKSSNSGLRARGEDAYSNGTDAYSKGDDAYSNGTDAFSMGTDAYSKGTDAFSMGTSKVQAALKEAPQYRCKFCGHVFGSDGARPVCPECKKRSRSHFPV